MFLYIFLLTRDSQKLMLTKRKKQINKPRIGGESFAFQLLTITVSVLNQKK